jgi:hypothetical protein
VSPFLWPYNNRCTRKFDYSSRRVQVRKHFWHQIVTCWVCNTRQLTSRRIEYNKFIPLALTIGITVASSTGTSSCRSAASGFMSTEAGFSSSGCASVPTRDNIKPTYCNMCSNTEQLETCLLWTVLIALHTSSYVNEQIYIYIYIYCDVFVVMQQGIPRLLHSDKQLRTVLLGKQ